MPLFRHPSALFPEKSATAVLYKVPLPTPELCKTVTISRTRPSQPTDEDRRSVLVLLRPPYRTPPALLVSTVVSKENSIITMTKVRVNSGALGFPRMGPNREMKFALEKHWRGAIDEKAMLVAARSVEDQAWALQMEAGVGKIAAGDHCLYDNMLAW